MTKITEFDEEICKKVDYYVYRLIDPRNGQTFYVGKGKGNRVFQHIKAAKDKKDLEHLAQKEKDDSEELKVNLKIKTIQAIHNTGLEVLHVIHRHGLTEEDALVVEAALIDAYPGLTNIQNGKDSGEYGCRSVEEIIGFYKADEVEFTDKDKLLLIKITDESIESRGNIYEAVRKFWILNPQRAKQAQYVLAVKGGIVEGIFTVNEKGWQSEGNSSNRYFFEGDEVNKDEDLVNRFMKHRIPDKYRKKGAANPVRYVGL